MADQGLMRNEPPVMPDIPLEEGERLDDLQIGGLMLIQNRNSFCFGIDAVLLSNYACVRRGETVLDIGTGTGVIPILLTAKTEGSHFTGLEIQENSVRLARRNVLLNGLCDRVDIISGDIKNCRELIASQSMNVIVSNPPYIRERDMESLMPEVRLYEPERALLGGEDGLCFYRRIIKGSDAFLKVNGSIFLEIGYDEGEDVSNLLKEAGFSDIRIIKDLSALDRVICAKKRI